VYLTTSGINALVVASALMTSALGSLEVKRTLIRAKYTHEKKHTRNISIYINGDISKIEIMAI